MDSLLNVNVTQGEAIEKQNIKNTEDSLFKESEQQICKHWMRNKTCFFGDKCKFLHPEDYEPPEKNIVEKKKNGRNKIKNRNKAAVFRRFLLETYGIENINNVIDVAGGKSELAFEFLNLNGINCCVIDPRELEIEKFEKRYRNGIYHRNEILQKYNTQKQKETIETPKNFRLFFEPELWETEDSSATEYFENAKQRGASTEWGKKGLVQPNTEKKLNKRQRKLLKKQKELQETDAQENPSKKRKIDNNIPPVEDKEKILNEVDTNVKDFSWEDVQNTLQNSDLITGLHADQATESIVDFGLKFKKPFSVIPCCVFSKLFPQRKNKEGKLVTKYEDFVEYLKNKHPDIQQTTLDMGGKNIVLYYQP